MEVHVPNEPGHDVSPARYWPPEQAGEAAVFNVILFPVDRIRMRS